MAIEWNDKVLARKLATMPERVDRYLSGVVRYHRPSTEAMAKRNAPWTDRTSNARNGLFANAVIEPKKRYAIVLAHSVPYGIWLEVRFSGRYAVILPTVNRKSSAVMRTVTRVLEVVSR